MPPVDEILLSYIHIPEWPSYTVLYEPRIGRAREVFFASGHHSFVRAEDLDDDGRAELLFAGINNALGWVNAVAAVRLDPWVNEEPSRQLDTTASPDAAINQGLRAGLLWYALLPRGTLRDNAHRLSVDHDRRTLTVHFRSGKTEVLGFDGFPLASRSALSSGERQAARKAAFESLREAKRLRAVGDFPLALQRIEDGLGEAVRADDPRLRECLRRLEGRTLVRAGRITEAEALFSELVGVSENAPEIAYEAAEAFHLAGELSSAVRWYRRGLDLVTDQGKQPHEYAKGELMALVESGRIPEARRAADRFAASYPTFPEAALFREFVRWRAGEVPQVEGLRVTQNTPDLERYWYLEFEYARDAEPRVLLSRVEEELVLGPETRAELLSLKAELLSRLKRTEEAREAARRALEIAERERIERTATRAHFTLIEERFARIARVSGRGEAE